jgi:cytidine deaminase
MRTERIITEYTVYPAISALPEADRELLGSAMQSLSSSYAPYSGYHVGAAVRLSDGTVVTGSNQENAAFPASLCAERVALFAAAAGHPGVTIEAIAVTAQADRFPVEAPVTPCGMCRQAIAEYETRQESPVRLILGGATGEVFVVEGIAALLPLMFSEQKLQKH